MIFAIIKDGKVENIIKADQKFLDEHSLFGIELKPEDSIEIGSEYVDGNFVAPIKEVLIPAVKAAYFKVALHRVGLLETVSQFLANPDYIEAKILFEESQTFERDNAIVNQMAKVMSISDEDLDNLFLLGEAIQIG